MRQVYILILCTSAFVGTVLWFAFPGSSLMLMTLFVAFVLWFAWSILSPLFPKFATRLIVANYFAADGTGGWKGALLGLLVISSVLGLLGGLVFDPFLRWIDWIREKAPSRTE